MSDENLRQRHPEADLLAGFAENSLSQHERESVLNHLAVCERCRQVVFLAHQVTPQPAAESLATNLDARPFWQKNWFPLIASVSAVVSLAAISFSWYVQFHKPTAPQTSEVAQQRPAPLPPGNPIASGAVTAAPASAAKVLPDGRAKAQPQQLRGSSTAKKEIAAPSPESRPAEASDEASLKQLQDIQAAKAVARERHEAKVWLNSSQQVQSAIVAKSASSLKMENEDQPGFSSRTVQAAKVNHQSMDASSLPTRGAVGSGAAAPGQAYHPEVSAAAAEPSPASESKTVHAEGCVEQGVEAGCLVVKDIEGGKLYNIFIKGARPQPGEGIEFTGVPYDGLTVCMQGAPVKVITWDEKNSLNCAKTDKK